MNRNVSSITAIDYSNYNGKFARGNKFFELSNHLGNVLVTVSDKKIGIDVAPQDGVIDYYTADVVTANDYYPFGSQMPGRKYSQPNTKYRYGFNGKENDNEVKGEGNQQDYGLRIYDPRLGKFLSVDPLYRDYPWYTPYQFAGNDVIRNIDLDGAEPDPSTSGPVKNEQKVDATYVKPPVQSFILPSGPAPRPLFVPTKPGPTIGPNISPDQRIAAERLRLLGRIAKPVALTVVAVLIPLDANAPGYKPLLNPGNKPLTASPPQEENQNSKVFYATYTKSKLNSDGTTTTYSGRTSGLYSGAAPTQEDADAAVQNRENGHLVLKQEGYSPAITDRFSPSKAAIRGREQQLIDNRGGAQSEGGTSRNKIRGVGRSNPMRVIYNAAATASFGALPSNNPADQ